MLTRGAREHRGEGHAIYLLLAREILPPGPWSTVSHSGLAGMGTSINAIRIYIVNLSFYVRPGLISTEE